MYNPKPVDITSLTSAKFVGCDNLVDVRLSAPRLQALYLSDDSKLEKVELDAPELQTFVALNSPKVLVESLSQSLRRNNKLVHAIFHDSTDDRKLNSYRLESFLVSEDIEYYPETKNMRALTLTSCAFNHNISRAVVAMQGLESLTLINCDLLEGSIRGLGLSRSLKSVEIYSPKSTTSLQAIVDLLIKLSSLESLRLYDIELTKTALSEFFELRLGKYPKLDLGLRHTKLGNEGADILIAALKKHKDLTVKVEDSTISSHKLREIEAQNSVNARKH